MAIQYELTGQPMAGRAEYLYHILKAMDEAGVEKADELLKKAIYEVAKTRARKIGNVKNAHELWDKFLTEDLRQIFKADWV